MAIVHSSDVQIDKPVAVLQDNTGVLILLCFAHSKLNYRRELGYCKKMARGYLSSMALLGIPTSNRQRNKPLSHP